MQRRWAETLDVENRLKIIKKMKDYYQKKHKFKDWVPINNIIILYIRKIKNAGVDLYALNDQKKIQTSGNAVME